MTRTTEITPTHPRCTRCSRPMPLPALRLRGLVWPPLCSAACLRAWGRAQASQTLPVRGPRARAKRAARRAAKRAARLAAGQQAS